MSSTQTETQNSTEAAPTQGSHHWVMTLEVPGRFSNTVSGTWTPPTGWTRHDVFMAIQRDLTKQHPELHRANVIFFSLEPNQL